MPPRSLPTKKSPDPVATDSASPASARSPSHRSSGLPSNLSSGRKFSEAVAGSSRTATERTDAERAYSAGHDIDSDEARRAPRWRSVGVPALLSCLVLWAAFPPLGLAQAVWAAPLGLLWLIDRPERPGRGGYFWIWVAGSLLWLALLQGIRLAFWPLTFGWIALSLYLAIYLPLFVGTARILRHRWGWSLVWAAPVAWTGWELVRSYLLTGYAANTLAHTQYQFPLVIQVADQLGSYGLSFAIVAAAVALYRALERVGSALVARKSADRAAPPRAGSGRLGDLIVGAGVLAAVLGYGAWRLAEGDRRMAEGQPLLRAALIQENTPSMFDANPERLQQAWSRYASTTAQAIRKHGPVDVIVWPESTFTAMIPWMEDLTETRVPPEMEKQKFDRNSLHDLVLNYQSEFRNKVRTLLDIVHGSLPPESPAQTSDAWPYLLVGNDALLFTDQQLGRYNAALLLDPEGKLVGRYEKNHLVMFGEYIPLEWALGFLGDAFGFSSATPGTDARSFDVRGVRIAPSICFESMLPQMMAWQMRSLVAQGETPDVLVNITNDSWFRGSSVLDHHLACDVLAAVEMRRPFLIAANTGLTAWIAGTGRIKEVTPRLEPAFIVAAPVRDSRWGLTQFWGDIPAWCLAAICGLALLSSWPRRRRRTKM